jgi:hypothetical protein
VDLEEVKEKEEKDNILGLKEYKKGFKRAIKRAMLALIAKKLKQFLAPGKVIVYSSSVDSANSLRAALRCKVYY